MPVGPAWLVLPTYNEAASLERIVRAAHAVLGAAAPGGHRILVVDDASPDGTGELAERLAAELGTVAVLHRAGKAGLGRAYLAGFERALDAGARFVLTMDADGSHDPADLGRLLAAAPDAGLVLGSRYTPGGRVRDWGVLRRTLSRAGCWYARRVLGVAIRDLTGGFKCFRRDVLEGIDLSTVRSQGYAFQVELTYRALRRGFRVQEVPITFRDRRDGASKMTAGIAFEALWRVAQMRSWPPRPRRATRPAPPGTCRRSAPILFEARAHATAPDKELPPMAGLNEVTDANFQAEVLEAESPVLVDFWAPWCGPCRVVAPVLEEIASERNDLRIVKLNVDDNPQTASEYQVLSIPTLILFRNGQIAKKVVGAYPKRRLEAELEPALA